MQLVFRSFERGFSQVVDWFYVFDDFRQNDEFRTKFGSSNVSFIGALIIGRDDHFRDESEKNRFQWRKNNILVGSKKIVCMTYDELLAFFNVQIVNFEDMVREQNATR